MMTIEFINPRKEMKEISEIKSGEMFKVNSDTTDLNTGEDILAGTYFTKVSSNLEVDWNAVTNSGILHRLREGLFVECVNATLTIEK